MNWLDILLVVILLLSTVAAAQKGFAREVIGIAAAMIGLICGIWFYGLAGAFLLPYVSSPQVAHFVGFFIVFLGCVILGSIVTFVVRRFVKTVGLSWFDRMLGAVFGAVRGILLCMAVITAMVAFAPAVASDAAPASVEESRIAPYIVSGANFLIAIAPRELKDSFHSHYEKLKSFWEQKRVGSQNVRIFSEMKTIDELAIQLLESSFFMEEAVELLEKGMITGALQRTAGNQSEASKLLGIHRNTLQRKMNDFKIDGKRRKPSRKPMVKASADRPRRVKRG